MKHATLLGNERGCGMRDIECCDPCKEHICIVSQVEGRLAWAFHGAVPVDFCPFCGAELPKDEGKIKQLNEWSKEYQGEPLRAFVSKLNEVIDHLNEKDCKCTSMNS